MNCSLSNCQVRLQIMITGRVGIQVRIFMCICTLMCVYATVCVRKNASACMLIKE